MGSKQHEYARGYHDGREGRDLNDGSDAFTTLVTLGFAGGPRDNATDYHEGHRDGREDQEQLEQDCE